MMESLLQLIEGLPALAVVGAGSVLIAAIGLADHFTGAQLSLSVFYLMPISLVAWRVGRRWSYLFSAISAAVWYWANLQGSLAMGFTPTVLLWNTATRMGFFLAVSALTGSLRSVLERERNRTSTDPLTQLLNRRAFYQLAGRELERARRYRRPLSIIYLDFDGLKLLNDREGHAEGDKALQAVAEVLATNLRSSDAAARLGGDEFCVLLPEAGQLAAARAAAKLRLKLGQQRAEDRGGGSLNLSLGVVTYLEAPDTVDQMIGNADELMYAAKRSGRGGLVHQVIHATEAAP
jgi:diguanylate cyclase (GGDEF)-like protein